MRRCAQFLVVATALCAPLAALAREPPPEPPAELPPAPDEATAPPPSATPEPEPDLPRRPINVRHAFHLGLDLGIEAWRDGNGAFALGAGGHFGWELLFDHVAVELALEAELHDDSAISPEHWLWEVHPIAYVKLPFDDGAWELFAGYGVSPPVLHDGWMASDGAYHVAELGFEDRTSSWYSRFYARGYAPFSGSLTQRSAIILGVTVGFFGVL